jgi:assimilatory nitrate reductase catalytic subunit
VDFAELFVEIHPDDALRVGIKSADLCVLRSALGSITVRALVDDRQRPGSVVVPMHWTDQQASLARVDRLIAARTDPVSGQPELKFTPVALTPFAPAWHGFAVISARPRHIIADYWAIAPAKAGWRIELAGARSPRDRTGFARTLLLPDADADPHVLAYHDANSGQHRIALFRDDRLLGALFVAASPVAVSRSWAVEQLSARLNDSAARLRMLAGQAGGAVVDKGPLVCACHEVGINQIAEAASRANITLYHIGKMLGAGTNCGLCRPEIRKIIDEIRIRRAS